MNGRQLEFNLARSGAGRPAFRRTRRANRASWWFNQMRQVVDEAWEVSVRPPDQLPAEPATGEPAR